MIECGTRSLLTVERRWIRACKSYGEMANAFSFADRGWGPRASAGPSWRFFSRRIARHPWRSNGSRTNMSSGKNSMALGGPGRWSSCEKTGRAMLVLEDPGGEPLARLLGLPMEIGVFLRLAIGV